MKHNKVQLLILTGFLLIAVSIQAMEMPRSGSRLGSRSGSRASFGTIMQAESPQAQFWIALQLNPIDYALLDKYLTTYNKNLLLNHPIFYSYNPHQNTISYTYNSGEKVAESNSKGLLPLELAVDSGNATLVAYLLNRGARVDDLDQEDNAIIIQLKRIYDVMSNPAISLQEKQDATINVIIKTVLFKEDKINLIEGFMRDYGAQFGPEYNAILTSLGTILIDPAISDIDGVNAKIQLTAIGGQNSLLSIAIAKGFIELASYLLLHGADANDPGAQRLPIGSLVYTMCTNKNLTDEQFTQSIRLLQLLIQRGADINMRGLDSMSANMALMMYKPNYAEGSLMAHRLQRIRNAINNPMDPKI